MLASSGRGGRVDFERGMRHAPPLILFLIAANVAMFAWEIAAGALADRETIIEAGALVRERVLAGEWWRLVSAVFVACEHAVGGARTALVYFASGIAGGLLSMVMGPGPSVGASGAIFGIIAAVVVVMYRWQDRF